jgi:hypothetical protein
LVNGFTSEDIESSFYKGLDAVHIKKAKARENDSPGLPGGGRTVSPGPEITLDSDLLWNKPKAELMGKNWESSGLRMKAGRHNPVASNTYALRISMRGLRRME